MIVMHLLMLDSAEVRNWESQLGRIQKLLLEWSKIQSQWLTLEAIFLTEDIVIQMVSVVSRISVANSPIHSRLFNSPPRPTCLR